MKLPQSLILLISCCLLSTTLRSQSEFVVQTGHSSEVNKVEFSLEGNIFATAGFDNNIVLWEYKSGKQLRLIDGHRDHINDLEFIHGDSILVSCSNDSSIVFWNTYNGKKIDEIKTTFLPTSISHAKDSSLLYITAKILYKYDCDNHKLQTLITPKNKPLTIVKALDDGSVVVGGSKRNTFIHIINNRQFKHRGSIVDMEVNGAQSLLTTVGKTGNINQYTIGKKGFRFKKTLRSGYRYNNESSAMTANDSSLICLGKDNAATLYHPTKGMAQNYYLSNYYKARDIDLHPNGKTFVTVASNGTIYLWDVISGELIRDFKSNSSAINFAKFTTDKESIVIGYNNGLIRYWNLEYGGVLQSHKFQLSSSQIKKGWKYSVLSLEKQEGDVLHFKVVLTKPYKNISYFKECRFNEFSWNLKTNEKSLTETDVVNYEPFKTNFDDIVENNNRKYQNDSLFLLSDGTRVTAYLNDKPKNLGFETPHSNGITSVDYDPNKQIYLTASWDGQILMYDKYKKTIARLVTLGTDDFVVINDKEYYYATKGALQYVGFTEDHKSTSFEQYDLFYNRPDIVYTKFPYGSEETVKYLETLHNKRLNRLNMSEDGASNSASGPKTEINAINGAVSDTKTSEIRIQITDEYGLKDFSIRIDGVPVFESKKSHYHKKSIDTTLTINLQEGINKISFIAHNIKNVSSGNKSIYVKSTEKSKKPNLYFVGIGASTYKDTTKNLKYAKKDINDIQKTFKKSKQFKEKNYLTFYNESVHLDSLTKIDIFLADASVNDIVIMYYAGHGLLDKNLEYFLATYNNDFYAPEKNAISYSYIEDKLKNCKSRKKLLFLDACHSGELDKENATVNSSDIEIGKDIHFRSGTNTMISISDKGSLEALKVLFADLKENNGITVVSSAGGADYAIESDQWSNGAFTYCLIEGLKSGKSDLDNNGVITISDMLQYLQINVPLLTNGYQVPTYRSENIENDFIIWKK